MGGSYFGQNITKKNISAASVLLNFPKCRSIHKVVEAGIDSEGLKASEEILEEAIDNDWGESKRTSQFKHWILFQSSN